LCITFKINMKTFLIVVILISLNSTFGFSQENFNITYQSLYEQAVIDGRIDYGNIKNDPSILLQLVDHIEKLDANPLNEAQLINAYNIYAIKHIIDNYPVSSPKEILGFFNKLPCKVGNNIYTLNKIENAIKKKSVNGQYHFALICAAQSCPPFPKEAFTISNLKQQLNRQCELAFNSVNYIRVNNNLVFLPLIFNWYKKEFKKENRSIRQLLENHYRGVLPAPYSIKYYSYDWALNDVKEQVYIDNNSNTNYQSFTPSKLINKGSYELKMFNNLYSQTSFFNKSGKEIPQDRSSFFTGIIDFLYGTNDNINIGFNLFLRASRFDEAETQFLDILKFENNEQARFTVSHFGPSIKIAPFKNKKYSIKSILLIPLASDLSGRKEQQVYLDENAYQWWNQLFYDTKLNEKWRLFTEVTAILKLDKDLNFNQSSALIPFKAFLSYFPNQTLSFYAFGDLTASVASPVPYYLQTGVGTKIVMFNKFEVELLYSDFIAGRLTGAGKTYNLGLRYIH